MKILILTAMEKERQMFESIEQDKDLNGHNLRVCPCGIGKVNASVNTVKEILANRPDFVISTGVAGGCGKEIEIMDVVCAEKVCYHDVWCGQPNVLGQIQGMPAEFFAPENIITSINNKNFDGVKTGTTVSGDWFVDNIGKMQEIKNNFPYADAVDMESAAIAQVCNIYNIPFLSLRIISDLPLSGNNFAQYNDFWDNLQQKSFETAKKIIKHIININDIK